MPPPPDTLARLEQALLSPIDEVFARVREAQPGKLPCARGCSSCCVSGFSITILDVWRMKVGLAGLERCDRQTLMRQAVHTSKVLNAPFASRAPAQAHPWTLPYDLRDLEPSPGLDAFATLPCPALGSEGECRIYPFRPRICRLQGLRYHDPSGQASLEDFCADTFGDEDYRSIPSQPLDLFEQWELEAYARAQATAQLQTGGWTLDSGYRTTVTGALMMILAPGGTPTEEGMGDDETADNESAGESADSLEV